MLRRTGLQTIEALALVPGILSLSLDDGYFNDVTLDHRSYEDELSFAEQRMAHERNEHTYCQSFTDSSQVVNIKELESCVFSFDKLVADQLKLESDDHFKRNREFLSESVESLPFASKRMCPSDSFAEVVGPVVIDVDALLSEDESSESGFDDESYGETSVNSDSDSETSDDSDFEISSSFEDESSDSDSDSDDDIDYPALVVLLIPL
jgi:hypothetical protein